MTKTRGKKKKKNNGFINYLNKIVDDKIAYIIVIIFTILFSIFFYANKINYISSNEFIDSLIFKNIAYAMTRGQVLYKDIIDNKGPLLYFINYFLYILKDYNAIYIFSLLLGIITNIYIYKIARLKTGAFYSLLVVFICNAFFLSLQEQYFGIVTTNMTEFYAMPAFAYIYYKFLQKKYYNKKELIILGSLAVITFSLRANLVSISFITSIILLYNYIKEKKYKEVRKYIIYFSIGALVTLFILLIYFIKNNALKYILENYLLFNLKYAKAVNYSILPHDNRTILYLYNILNVIIQFNSNIYILIALSLAAAYIFKDQKVGENIIIITFCYILAAYISMRYYMHYLWVMVPLFSYPLSIIFENNKVKDMYQVVLSVLVIASIFYYLNNFKRAILALSRGQFETVYVDAMDYVHSIRDDDDRMLFVTYEIYDSYMRTNTLITPDYGIQFYFPALNDHVKKEFTSDPPEILVFDKKCSSFIGMTDLSDDFIMYTFIYENLDKYYNKTYENEGYEVYRKK